MENSNKNKFSFKIDNSNDTDKNKPAKRGYSVSKGLILTYIIVFILVCTGVGLIVYFTKNDVNFDKINKSSSLSQQTWDKVCVNYGCENIDKLTGLFNKCVKNEYSTFNPMITSTSQQSNAINFRLPNSLKPYRYELNFVTDNMTSNFNRPEAYSGLEYIHFTCVESTNKLIFHMKNIEIDTQKLYLQSENDDSLNLEAFAWRHDPDRELFIAEFNETIFRKNGNYSLQIYFTGFLKDDNFGFYRSSYKADDGTTRWLLASQMSPTHAHKAFPCFDEPDMKAIFEIKVTHNHVFQALSNMPVISSAYTNTGTYPERKLTIFSPTPVMSTYLIGLIVSDFKCIHAFAYLSNNRSVNVSACSRPNAVSFLNYALRSSIEILEYLENYCNISYPLPKLHNVAIPDFAVGAMENWGLITYRESRLLFDVNKTSKQAEQSIVSVISHETGHLWFGNLVSPYWWKYVWLKEGFARFTEYYVTHNIKPTWDMMEQFTMLVFNIMQLDSVASSHRISADVNKPSEINELFDDISYGKGASLVRMMVYILGDKTFQRGIFVYLNKYKYGTASEEDLFQVLYQQALSESKLNNTNFIEAMSTFTKQMGHPVVAVKLSSNNKIMLEQKHFLLDPTAKPLETSDYNYTWYIPFTYSIETIGIKNTETFNLNESNIFNKIFWFKPNDKIMTITLNDNLKDNQFVLANLDAFGFYRVNYDDDVWTKIINQLKNYREAIPLRNRAQILNDVFGLAQAFVLNATIPFEVISYISSETDALPWNVAIKNLGYISDQLLYTSAYGDLQEYLLNLIKPTYERLGWIESQSETWSNRIPTSFRSFVYCTAITHGTAKEWLFASKIYDIETDSNARNELQAAMSCTKEPWLIQKFLNDQLNTSKVRVQDTLNGIRSASLRTYASPYAWNFVKNNWNELLSRYGSGLSFARLITDVSYKFNTKQQLNDLERFFEENTNQGSASREVSLSKDRIKANILWIQRNYEAIASWLSAYMKIQSL